MTEASAQDQAYLTLLQLEKEARHADTVEALGYILANRARVLVAHNQAVLFRLHPHTDKHIAAKVAAISDVPTPDQNAPFVRWLNHFAKLICATEAAQAVHEISVSTMSQHDQEDAGEWLATHIMWCPLKHPDGTLIGALLIGRSEPWRPADAILMEHLTDAWGHAWSAQLGPRARRLTKSMAWPVRLGIAAVLAVQFMPVSQTALAPAEVVAQKPELVAAPMDGAIKTVHILPNSAVEQGALLFSYDDTSLSGRLEVANEELLVAHTALRTARQGAFRDAEKSAEVALLQAQVALREAERDLIASQVAQKDVRAGRSGVAVFRDASDLEGRPVTTGERIMLIADPHETELRIELPVADAIVLNEGSPVRLFLDRNPLTPIDAILEHAGYEAEMTQSGVLSYRLIARFVNTLPPRVGLRGTAKIEGGEVALFFYLFRRPISALRQWLGL